MASTKPCDMGEQELLVKTSNKITSAMASDHPFFMSFKEVQKLFNSQSACAYSGELFSTTGDITFERVNPLLPYVKGNVLLVRKHLNSLKGNTIDKFIHESGMSLDAQADLFAMISRSLRAEFKRTQHPRGIQASSKKSVEQRIAEAVNSPAVKQVVEEVAPTPSKPAGNPLFQNVFAKANQKSKGE